MDKEIVAKETTGKEFLGNKRMLIGCILLVVAALMGLMLIFTIRANNTTVYFSKDTIAKGVSITEDMVVAKRITDKTIAKTGYQKANDLIGKAAVRDIPADAMITVYDFEVIGSDTAAISSIPQGKQIISISPDSVNAFASYIPKKGDLIRLYDRIEYKKDENGLTPVSIRTPEVLMYVEVYNVYDASGRVAEASGSKPSSIALICGPEQAASIVARDKTDYYFALMIPAADAAAKERALAEQDRLIQNYVAEQESLAATQPGKPSSELF